MTNNEKEQIKNIVLNIFSIWNCHTCKLGHPLKKTVSTEKALKQIAEIFDDVIKITDDTEGDQE